MIAQEPAGNYGLLTNEWRVPAISPDDISFGRMRDPELTPDN
jgi:hypothetical protein